MEMELENVSHRDKQILCGLFLSHFDRAGLDYFGFENFTEAFNTLGYALHARPASIKNYRDELDPYFPNTRMGWHGRPLREHCKRVLEEYRGSSLEQLGKIIKAFLSPVSVLEAIPEVNRVLKRTYDDDSSFAKRMITGRAAEHYFVSQYETIPDFTGQAITDTTQWGCGFDFKISSTTADTFCAVEVKGLRGRYGQIQLTALEYDMALTLAERYYLVLVRNFTESPYHTVIQNPVHGGLTFKKVARRETRFSWMASVVA